MTQHTKRVTLILLTLTMLAVILLSSSLSSLRLQSGLPFPAADPQYTVEGSLPGQNRSNLSVTLQVILKLILLLLMIYVPLRLILVIRLKWLFRVIQVLAIVLIIVFVLSFIKLESTAELPEIVLAVSTGTETSPLGEPPQGFIYFVMIGFTLAAVFFIAKVFARQVGQSHSDHSLLMRAEAALQAIRAGEVFENVIVRCYMEMADVLQKEYGIARDQHLTPREFEDVLEFQGLPSHPIRELTDLFEKVRYGRQQLSTSDEKQAIESLSAIVRYARGTP